MNTVTRGVRLFTGVFLIGIFLGGCSSGVDKATASVEKANVSDDTKATSHEVKELRIGRQIGLGYLPLYIMQDKKLIEKYAKQEGLGDVKVTYKPLASPAVINDSLLSGNVDMGSAGLVPFLTLWDKTKGRDQEVRMLSSISMEPLILTTVRPGLKSMRDLTPKDRIAVPAIKTSMNAMLLDMAEDKEVGHGKETFVDTLEVPFSHADAVVALLSGKSTITGHMATMPFSDQELQHQQVHKVFSSYDITGGPTTIMALWASKRFHDQNPKLIQAVYSALNEADAFINKNRAEAAKIYIKIDHSSLNQAFIEKILTDPNVVYSLTPQKTMLFANYLYKHGMAKNKPESWKDLFFSEAYNLPGS